MLSLDSFNESQCVPCETPTKQTKFFNHDGCVVCLEEEPDTRSSYWMLLPCTHSFHGDCILKWVQSNFSCPTCRAQVGSFVPLTGTKVRQEFNDLWREYYLEKPSPTKEIELQEDNLKKPVRQEMELDVEEFDLLLEDGPVKILTSFTEQPTCEENLSSVSPKTDVSVTHTQQSRSVTFDLAMTREFIKVTRTTPPLFRFWQQSSNIPIQLNDEARLKYETFDNLRAGACSGVFTTIGRMLVDRQPLRRLYPVLREVGPNVAIYFTTYEEMKRILGRDSDNYADIGKQCFISGCVGGFFAYLPRYHFNPLIPLQFGIHFSIFEMAKQCITLQTGRKRLTVADVGSTAILGGICGSCITFPLGNLGANFKIILEGGAIMSLTKGLTTNFLTHILRSSPGWAITATGFEFSRRVITQT